MQLEVPISKRDPFEILQHGSKIFQLLRVESAASPVQQRQQNPETQLQRNVVPDGSCLEAVLECSALSILIISGSTHPKSPAK